MGNSPIISRINAFLAEKGVQKQQFYKGCGITSASYSLWNTGKTTPRRKNLDVIANYLNTTTDYLLTGLGEREKASTLADERNSSESIERMCMDGDLIILAQRLENVPEKTRKRFLKNFTDIIDIYLDDMGIPIRE